MSDNIILIWWKIYYFRWFLVLYNISLLFKMILFVFIFNTTYFTILINYLILHLII